MEALRNDDVGTIQRIIRSGVNVTHVDLTGVSNCV